MAERQTKWQREHAVVRLYPSTEWHDQLEDEAAQMSVGLRQYLEWLLEHRDLILNALRDRTYVDVAPQGIKCPHCTHLLPDYLIDQLRAKRDLMPPDPAAAEKPSFSEPSEPVVEPEGETVGAVAGGENGNGGTADAGN